MTNPSTLPAGKADTRIKGPAFLPLELIQGAGATTGLYLHDHRIVGSKPWGGGHSIHTWHVRSEHLVNLIKQAQKRGLEQLLVEVYVHPDRSFSVFIDNVLLPARRKRDCGERRPGSTLVARSFAEVAEFARTHDMFAFLDESNPLSSGAPQGHPAAMTF